jgi:hypothetical protein
MANQNSICDTVFKQGQEDRQFRLLFVMSSFIFLLLDIILLTPPFIAYTEA